MNAPREVDLPLPLAARRSTRLRGSLVREILKAALQPGMISRDGGLPSPQSSPARALRKAFDRVLDGDTDGALQYGPTEGHASLREWIAAHESARGVVFVPGALIFATAPQSNTLRLSFVTVPTAAIDRGVAVLA